MQSFYPLYLFSNQTLSTTIFPASTTSSTLVAGGIIYTSGSANFPPLFTATTTNYQNFSSTIINQYASSDSQFFLATPLPPQLPFQPSLFPPLLQLPPIRTYSHTFIYDTPSTNIAPILENTKSQVVYSDESDDTKNIFAPSATSNSESEEVEGLSDLLKKNELLEAERKTLVLNQLPITYLDLNSPNTELVQLTRELESLEVSLAELLEKDKTAEAEAATGEGAGEEEEEVVEGGGLAEVKATPPPPPPPPPAPAARARAALAEAEEKAKQAADAAALAEAEEKAKQAADAAAAAAADAAAAAGGGLEPATAPEFDVQGVFDNMMLDLEALTDAQEETDDESEADDEFAREFGNYLPIIEAKKDAVDAAVAGGDGGGIAAAAAAHAAAEAEVAPGAGAGKGVEERPARAASAPAAAPGAGVRGEEGPAEAAAAAQAATTRASSAPAAAGVEIYVVEDGGGPAEAAHAASELGSGGDGGGPELAAAEAAAEAQADTTRASSAPAAAGAGAGERRSGSEIGGDEGGIAAAVGGLKLAAEAQDTEVDQVERKVFATARLTLRKNKIIEVSDRSQPPTTFNISSSEEFENLKVNSDFNNMINQDLAAMQDFFKYATSNDQIIGPKISDPGSDENHLQTYQVMGEEYRGLDDKKKNEVKEIFAKYIEYSFPKSRSSFSLSFFCSFRNKDKSHKISEKDGDVDELLKRLKKDYSVEITEINTREKVQRLYKDIHLITKLSEVIRFVKKESEKKHDNIDFTNPNNIEILIAMYGGGDKVIPEEFKNHKSLAEDLKKDIERIKEENERIKEAKNKSATNNIGCGKFFDFSGFLDTKHDKDIKKREDFLKKLNTRKEPSSTIDPRDGAKAGDGAQAPAPARV